MPRATPVSLALAALVALTLALAACAEDDDAAAGLDAAPDAAMTTTQVFTIEQPAAPALQQLINSCASGFDARSCDAMCRSVLCPFVTLSTLEIYACTLSRKGPIATVTVTYEGPVFCPPPPPSTEPFPHAP